MQTQKHVKTQPSSKEGHGHVTGGSERGAPCRPQLAAMQSPGTGRRPQREPRSFPDLKRRSKRLGRTTQLTAHSEGVQGRSRSKDRSFGDQPRVPWEQQLNSQHLWETGGAAKASPEELEGTGPRHAGQEIVPFTHGGPHHARTQRHWLHRGVCVL